MNKESISNLQKLLISDILTSKGFILAGKSFGYSEEKIRNHFPDILRLQEFWIEQGYIEIVDVNHSGFRPYGIAKNSNKYPDQYKNLYHVRLTNKPDPIILLRIEKDIKKPNFHTIKIVTMADHSKVFDNKDNDLMKNFVISVIHRTERY